MDSIERKVTKIGNSYGITFPLDFLKEAGISYGDNVSLKLKDGNIILQKKEEIKLPEGVDSDFMDVLNDVIKEHDAAFKGLVDK
ncbi:AbrB/MazE/SpoVT family DNA-binding domain-containing protein [Virgibacillus sp. DJP39]|uniref:AbrB/MazE/SpoVT family DNA-binding domain-containing protein n=1 Tax=Virgibacillus sp. DJP39 TaxID=3409790 RepID=UPI003BB675E1